MLTRGSRQEVDLKRLVCVPVTVCAISCQSLGSFTSCSALCLVSRFTASSGTVYTIYHQAGARSSAQSCTSTLFTLSEDPRFRITVTFVLLDHELQRGVSSCVFFFQVVLWQKAKVADARSALLAVLGSGPVAHLLPCHQRHEQPEVTSFCNVLFESSQCLTRLRP